MLEIAGGIILAFLIIPFIPVLLALAIGLVFLAVLAAIGLWAWSVGPGFFWTIAIGTVIIGFFVQWLSARRILK